MSRISIARQRANVRQTGCAEYDPPLITDAEFDLLLLQPRLSSAKDDQRMNDLDKHFLDIVHTSLIDAGVRRRLETAPAVVLERIARGGGATSWYRCSNLEALDRIEGRLSPGSVVTFYHDQRIKTGTLTTDTVAAIKDIIAVMGDAVVGPVDADGIQIHAEIIVSEDDLAEFVAIIPLEEPVFYGAFPKRDNDGTHAITVTLPDRDGVVRMHPH
jgi:hypothetical protein